MKRLVFLSKHAEHGDGASSESLKRLKIVVKNAGGPSEVARKTGLPLGSLNHYLSGREMKLGAAVAIASACNVSLSFLATGSEVGAGLPDIEILAPAVLSAPAHFSGLILLTRACQEFHEGMRQKPSLAQALTWISPIYLKTMALPESQLRIFPESDVKAEENN